MGPLSGRLPLPTSQYVAAAPRRVPVEDERMDVIFSTVLIVPFLVSGTNSSGRYRRRGDGQFSSVSPRSPTILPYLAGKLFFQRVHHELHERHAGPYTVQSQRPMQALRHSCGKLD